jgi:hypothetical protein
LKKDGATGAIVDSRTTALIGLKSFAASSRRWWLIVRRWVLGYSLPTIPGERKPISWRHLGYYVEKLAREAGIDTAEVLEIEYGPHCRPESDAVVSWRAF